MSKKTYTLDKNDPEYKDWIYSRQAILFKDNKGEFVYQYDHSETQRSEHGEWIHVLVPITGKGYNSPINLKSSPGWRPQTTGANRQSKTPNFRDLPNNQHGHAQLTDDHYNYIRSVADDFSRTDYLIAFKVLEDYPESGLHRGYYLVTPEKMVIALGDLTQFYSCDHFLDVCISKMKFV